MQLIQDDGLLHPQATTIPSGNGRPWANVPLPAPTLTIFRRSPACSADGRLRMQSMIEASTFPNGFGPPPPTALGLPPILPQAPPSAAGVSTSLLPAIMDGSVGPATDGSATAHNVGVTTKPPENASLTATQLRERLAVARGATDRKARVSFSFTTLTNGAVTTAPKHACVGGSALLSFSRASLPERQWQQRSQQLSRQQQRSQLQQRRQQRRSPSLFLHQNITINIHMLRLQPRKS